MRGALERAPSRQARGNPPPPWLTLLDTSTRHLVAASGNNSRRTSLLLRLGGGLVCETGKVRLRARSDVVGGEPVWEMRRA